MTAPVYQPPSQVDGSNIASFQRTVTHSAARYGHVVVDCSQVMRMGPSAMRVLEFAARSADVVLVNPNQAIQLLAAAYGIRITACGAPASGQSHALTARAITATPGTKQPAEPEII